MHVIRQGLKLVAMVSVCLLVNTAALATTLTLETGQLERGTDRAEIQDVSASHARIVLRLGKARQPGKKLIKRVQVSYLRESADFGAAPGFDSHEEVAALAFTTRGNSSDFLTTFGIGVNLGRLSGNQQDVKIAGASLELGALAPIYSSNFSLRVRGRLSYYENAEEDNSQLFDSIRAGTGRVGIFYVFRVLDFGLSYYFRGWSFARDSDEATVENSSSGVILATLIEF